MERMKTNAAARRIENGVCKKMIQIDKHCCKHEQPRHFPITLKKDPSNKSWCQNMKGIMEECLEEHERFDLSLKDELVLSNVA